MRIPLDYYRILSVPIKATNQQLEQAKNDRLVQLPRREYSEQAIDSRQELIKQAYQVLSDAEQRANYDAQFLVSIQPLASVEVTEDSESPAIAEEVITEESLIADVPLVNPTIEIKPTQFIGALLILHELGEYELVLTLGIDYYNSQEFGKLQQQQQAQTNQEIQENIILSVALAYMELGREQWQRQEYETAALSSQLGVDLLNQENLFPQVKQELELDLDKLRPYRVLELISQNPPNSVSRVQGFQLLQEMLVKREGIEGKGKDRSGLNNEQFLYFIQQLRTYLTSIEQQQLFDHEIHNDSAIASYLAVYALLARGFCNQQPELVLRAQRKLDYLSLKQDVAWEQAVCALLLGHTEKAIGKVCQSQDTSKLNQILQHAPGSKDLLAGMCFYGEQWLHQDVLSQFVDLAKTKLTLKEYFANPEVQAYLDELVPSTVATTTQKPSSASSAKNETVHQDSGINGIALLSRWRNLFSSTKTAPAKVAKSSQVTETVPELAGVGGATKVRQTSAPKHSQSKARSQKPRQPKAKSKQHIQTSSNSTRQNVVKAKSKSPSLPLQSKARAVPPSVMQKSQGKVTQKKVITKKKPSNATILKGWLFIFGLIFGVGALGYAATKLFIAPADKTAAEPQLAIAISEPNINLPTVTAKPPVAKPKPTFAQQSQQVIEKWLKSKSAAFGKEHQIGELDSILAEPLLTTWRDRATAYQQSNSYREYQHQIEMRKANIDPQNSNRATVEAEVKEVAQHYQSGQLDNAQSYDDNLLVRYQLVRQNQQWLIQNAEVLETL